MNLARVKASVTWLLDHWYIPFTVLGAVISYGLLRKGATPAERAQVEFDAVSAKRQVAQIALDKGAEAAHAHVAQIYAAQQAQMTEDNRREADTLQTDPPALAAYLVRLGARLAMAEPPASPDQPDAAKPKP